MNAIDYWYKKYMALKETERIPKPELTWEDIRIITKILEEVTGEDIQVEFFNGGAISCYKEVLRRFKEEAKK